MKFSIRDLLLLTTIAAIAAGWWVDQRRLRQEIKRLDPPSSPFGLTPNGTPTPTLTGFYQTGPWPDPIPPVDNSYFHVQQAWPLAIAAAAFAALAVLGWYVVRFKFIRHFGMRELLWSLALAAILTTWGIDHVTLDAERDWLQRMDAFFDNPYSYRDSR